MFDTLITVLLVSKKHNINYMHFNLSIKFKIINIKCLTTFVLCLSIVYIKY